ncbi:MAG: class I SAM-dependent methyltransferase, partial [Pseudomonadota bacterium]|nr:class I SAM-dependent methyltransferase [Pseudomonadota bacterium]
TPIETSQVDLYQRLPFADKEFNLVFNFRFFHHIRDDAHRQHVIAELSRISGRYLIVSYYANSAVHALQKRLWRRTGHTRDLPMISTSEFHRCFRQHGCEIVEDRAVLPGIHAHHITLMRRT